MRVSWKRMVLVSVIGAVGLTALANGVLRLVELVKRPVEMAKRFVELVK